MSVVVAFTEVVTYSTAIEITDDLIEFLANEGEDLPATDDELADMLNHDPELAEKLAVRYMDPDKDFTGVQEREVDDIRCDDE